MFKVNIPLNVPSSAKAKYYSNYKLATQKTGRLMLLAGDQKMEHLNDDFYGKSISTDDANPKHLFEIAKSAKVGVLATHLGLVNKYGKDYRSVPYLIKLNGKTNLITEKEQDPQSLALHTVEQVLEFAKTSRLKIVGVGYTIYLGSRFETKMLAEASQIIFKAQQNGLITVLWIYPRGKAVKNEKDAHLLAGASGISACLGADFVKLPYPEKAIKTKVEEIIQSAGKTKVIFSGGKAVDKKKFLTRLKQQISWGAQGVAVGRNIHQKSLAEAVDFAKAIKTISLNK